MKKQIIEQIQSHLIEELADLTGAGEKDLGSSLEGLHSPEALERAGEIQRLLLQYQFLPVRDYGPEDVVCPAALVELDLGGTRTFCFIVPQGGGMVMKVENQPVQVVTPNSPLGEALLGKKVGETAEVQMPGRPPRVYRVIGIS